jgi:hypothetical protein
MWCLREIAHLFFPLLSLANGHDGSSLGDGPIPPALGRTNAAD